MKNLSYQQFEQLRQLGEGFQYTESDGISSDMDSLIDSGGKLTVHGYTVLERYAVKRAVLMAAGIGSRMLPLTQNKPKPLIPVNGVVIVEPLLNAAVRAGIEEIIIVRGYLGEQFDYLKEKYPHSSIKFIDNPDFEKANNISSVWWAREYLANAYVMEADLLLYNPALIQKHQYRSNYLGVPVDETDDWCFKMNGEYISEIHVGGKDCVHMYGVSYWSEADGRELCRCLEEIYPQNPQLYWDEVALKYYKDRFQIAVRPCSFADITEIDTLQELAALDPSYRTFLHS